jgi:hypothetical protein
VPTPSTGGAHPEHAPCQGVILRGFLQATNGDEFKAGHNHPLDLQQPVKSALPLGGRQLLHISNKTGHRSVEILTGVRLKPRTLYGLGDHPKHNMSLGIKHHQTNLLGISPRVPKNGLPAATKWISKIRSESAGADTSSYFPQLFMYA